METYKTFIGGAWVDAASGDVFETANPANGQVWATLPRCAGPDVDRAVAAARTAFETGDWPRMSPTQRGAVLRRMAELVPKYANRIASVETRDGGRLLSESIGQVNYMPNWFNYYAGLADKIEGAVAPIDRPDMLTFTKIVPLGVIAAFTSWNAPFMMMVWKMTPALAAGNTIVIKPSEFSSASTLEFMKLVEEAGVPPGVINVVTGFGAEAGDALVSHPDVAKISFTGGQDTARQVAVSAARNLTPAVFELGGKSANIIFDDARIDQAVKGAVAGIFAAAGQTCVAGSRLLLSRKIHDEFIDKLIQYTAAARLGDPTAKTTQIGPIGTKPQHKRVLDYVDIAKQDGADLVFGGEEPNADIAGTGWFVKPTIFAGVNNQMRIAREEVFGPILSIIPFDDDEEAVAIANDTPTWLAGGVWSRNTGRAMRSANRLQAGTVWINTYRAVSYMVPFGGMKSSGTGRENGQHAIEEFLQPKAFWLSYAETEAEPFVMQ